MTTKENKNQDIEVYERLTRLETKVDEILDNHLTAIERKVNWGIALIVTTLVGIVVDLLMK